MSQVLPTSSLNLPPEVIALAVGQEVDSYVPAVLKMTQRIFPNSIWSVEVDDDPEIANERHLVVAVQASSLSVSEALEARYQWHRELFACCPAPLVCTFRLGLELTP
jgi:hypothetical protein